MRKEKEEGKGEEKESKRKRVREREQEKEKESKRKRKRASERLSLFLSFSSLSLSLSLTFSHFLPKFSTFSDPGSQDRAISATLVGGKVAITVFSPLMPFWNTRWSRLCFRKPTNRVCTD